MNAAAKLTRARGQLIIGQPFWGTLAMQLALSESPGITDTMATDGATLFYNAEYVASLSDFELMGVWAHEVEHCARSHFARLQGRDLADFNAAADYAINGDLRRAGFILPKGILIDAKYAGMGAEEIYAILRGDKSKEASKAQEGQQGQPGQPGADQGQGEPAPGAGDAAKGQEGQGGDAGQPGAGDAGDAGQPGNGAANGAGQGQGGDSAPGAGDGTGQPGNGATAPGAGNGAPGAGQPGAGQGQPGAHGMGGIIAPQGGNPAAIADMANKWQVATRQALAVAKAANAGTLPGNLQNLAAEIQEPVADFRDLLRDWIDSRIVSDFSFARPNNRFIGSRFIVPAAVVDGLEHVVFIVDTSGSMTGPMINAAASEIVGAMESGKIARLTVLMADTRVCSVAEFTAGDDVELIPAGGGGTDFRDSFQWVADNAPDASAVVYLTDLEVSQFGQEPDCPVLWATHGDSRQFARLAARVPFGQPVYIGRL